MHDKVDVSIIGSGASGAAVAWSLADTRMRILCLKQGDWVKPTDYPSNAPGSACSAISPSITIGARGPPTIQSTTMAADQARELHGVGGGTIMYTAHFLRHSYVPHPVFTLMCSHSTLSFLPPKSVVGDYPG